MARLPRGGSHLQLIGEVYFYRRAVRADAKLPFEGAPELGNV
jgi:hypothetical protein